MIAAMILFLRLSARHDYRVAYPLPSNTVPSGLGVCVHLTDVEHDGIPDVAKVGFKWIRTDLTWQSVEKVKGVFDFKKYDQLVNVSQENSLRIVFILDYGNPLYGERSPDSQEYLGAFKEFVRQAVTRYQRKGVAWEVWNEPDGQFWNPKGDTDGYIKLLQETVRTIRDVAPDEWIIGPAASRFNKPFLSRIKEAGCFDLLDAISVHTYRNSLPETISESWNGFRPIFTSNSGEARPVIDTEWGYIEKADGVNEANKAGWKPPQATPKLQASYAVRTYLANLANEVNSTFWYDWRDDAGSFEDPETHFGLMARDLKPKLAANYVTHFVNQFRDFTFAKTLTTADPNAVVYAFTKGDLVKLLVFAKSGSSTLAENWGSRFTIDGIESAKENVSKAASFPIILAGEPMVLTPSYPSSELIRAVKR